LDSKNDNVIFRIGTNDALYIVLFLVKEDI